VSLRLRLVFAVAVVALVALAGADVATFSSFRASLIGRLDSTLRAAAGPLEACLDRGGRLTPTILTEASPGIVAEVRSAGGRILQHVEAVSVPHGVAVAQFGPAIAKPTGLRALVPSRGGTGPLSDDCLQPRPLGPSAKEAPFRPVRLGTGRYFTSAGAGAAHPAFRVRLSVVADRRLLVIAVPFQPTADILERLLFIELGVSAAALIVAIGLGMLLVRVGVRPLLEVERTAEDIVGGDLDARVPERFREQTEIGRLTHVLNSMLGRLSEEFHARDETAKALARSENRMRQFLADASHELRTPIAAISAYAELFSTGAADRPEDLSRVLSGVRAETARMETLVEDLVLLASLDEGRPIEQHPVELVALCAEAVRAASAIGSQWPIELVALDSVEVVGDGTRLRQVVDNLLANVRAHTPAGTTATVRVLAEDGDAVIEVADRGPGLGESVRGRVFERFFREDTSRSRASGGTGLGLAIVQAIVAAHGGTVEVSDTPGGGATFTVRLPRADCQPPSR
jgi:two-component system OmpR family sensor kinase